jgi:hypothetical protein
MSQTVKDVLLNMVDELQDLRANQLVLARRTGNPTSLAQAAESKSIADLEVRESYRALRDRIEQL